jgi:hypothetical protein
MSCGIMSATLAGADTVGTALTSDNPAQQCQARLNAFRLLESPTTLQDRAPSQWILWRRECSLRRCYIHPGRLRSALQPSEPERTIGRARGRALAHVSAHELSEVALSLRRRGADAPDTSAVVVRGPASASVCTISGSSNQPHTGVDFPLLEDAMRHDWLCASPSRALLVLDYAVRRTGANGQWETHPPHVRRWFQGRDNPTAPGLDAASRRLQATSSRSTAAATCDRHGRQDDMPNGTKSVPQDEMGQGARPGASSSASRGRSVAASPRRRRSPAPRLAVLPSRQLPGAEVRGRQCACRHLRMRAGSRYCVSAALTATSGRLATDATASAFHASYRDGAVSA